MSSLHETMSPIAVALCGLVGVWGVLMARRETVPGVFYWAVGVAIVVILGETVLGVLVDYSDGVDPGEQHVFYGALIPVTLTLAYLYRSQLRKRPALYYGLLLLFTSGLGIRGIMTFGENF